MNIEKLDFTKIVPVTLKEMDLLEKSPDAFLLLVWLRRWSFDRDEFGVSNAMHEYMPGGGWTLRRFVAARSTLMQEHKIVLVRPAMGRGGQAIYAWGV